MSISKKKLDELAKSLDDGVLSNGVSDSAANELNRIVSKALAVAFPKGSSVELESFRRRVRSLPPSATNPLNLSADAQPCLGPSRLIPLATVKRMIRAQAGDFKVPDDTINAVCGMMLDLVLIVMNNAKDEIKDGVARLDAKHIKSSMSNRANNNSLLAASLMNVRARRVSSSKSRSSSRRRSRSAKKRSSSRKRCGRGKSPVRSFKRDGLTIKSYCRKKSSPRRR